MRFALYPAVLLCLGIASVATVPAAVARESPAASIGQQVNDYRRTEGRPALRRNAKAEAAAKAHATDMVKHGFFEHRGTNGSSVGGRLRAAGCTFTAAGENIAKGWKTDGQVVAAWIASPGHQRNLVGKYRQYGAAQVGDVWVLVLASGC